MPPKLAPLLGKTKSSAPISLQKRLQATIESIAGLCFVVFIFWHIVHYFQAHIHAASHHLLITALYPFIGVSFIASTMPFLVYLTLYDDFSDLHPLYPPHYTFLVKRIYQAATRSTKTMKVSSKNF